jgi:CheY-like chemotaxis protein
MAKILVVDDEKLLVKGMKFNLENEGYQVSAPTTAPPLWNWPGTAGSI